MKILSLDVETTISNRGNPFDKTNKLVQVGLKSGSEPTRTFLIEYDEDEPYVDKLTEIQTIINDHDLLIGFNIKFDLNWLKRYSIDFADKRIWDCQLGQFIIDGQANPYPSLNKTCAIYGFEQKLDVVSEEYWKNGIDTTEVPVDILTEYLAKDVDLTYQVFLKQQEALEDNPQLKKLIRLHNADLLGLHEIETNGLMFNQKWSEELAEELTKRIEKLDKLLYQYHNFHDFNVGSNDHVSVLLYGGEIKYKEQELDGVYKTGARKGEDKYKWVEKVFTLPRLVTPIKSSERAKEGFYKVNEPTLRQLKGRKKAMEVIELLLSRSEVNKRLTTYYRGLPDLNKEMNWEDNKLHGNLNQCVASTGRLSSSKPNIQNFDGEIKTLFYSRYEDGLLLNSDASSLEWVCVAYLSQDKVAIQEILDKKDNHSDNQERFGLPSRLIAKTFVFRLIYGGSAWSYANDPNFKDIGDEDYWQNVIDKFYEKYQGIKDYHDKSLHKAKADRKLIMPTGRVYHFEPEIRFNKVKYPRTKILNYPVQGLGADLMAIVRVSLRTRLKGLEGIKIINTVHDSIMIDTKSSVVDMDNLKTIVDECFTNAPSNFEKLFGVEFNLPMRQETQTGKTWGSMSD